MPLIYGFGNLFIICIISIFVHTQAATEPTMADIKNAALRACNDVEDIPQTVCNAITDPLKKRIDRLCETGVNTACRNLPWPIKLLISTGSCEGELTWQVCGSVDEAIRHARAECIEELEKIVIGQGCNGDGNQVNLCNGLLTTVGGICTAVIDFLAGELPFPFDPIIPYIQRAFAEEICDRLP